VTVKQISVFAPASIANLGPGFDVFGLALDSWGDIIKINKITKPEVEISIIGDYKNIPLDAKKNSAGAVLLDIIKREHLDHGFNLEIKKGVPTGKGLGSSGASAAAAAYACKELLNLEIDNRELVEIAAQGEAAVAGSAHADNVSPSLFGGFIIVGENYEVIRLNVPEVSLVVVIPDVFYENKTKLARELLPNTVELKNAVKNIGYASRMVAAVALNDPVSFGKSICDNLIEPHRAKMIPYFNEVKRAALNGGAYGCSIAGGGPSVFAVGPNPMSIGKAMQEAFKEIPSEIYLKIPSNQGARVI
jgi:homoserine kinase